MTHAGPPPREWLAAPHMADRAPRGSLWQPRASAWCGIDGHPRQVLVRRSGDALEGALRAWRCPSCGRERW